MRGLLAAAVLVSMLVGGCATNSSQDQRILGLITALTPDEVTIEDAGILWDGAADAAASADGRVAVKGFYLRVYDTRHTFPVDVNSPVTVIGYDPAGHPSPIPYPLRDLGALIGSQGSRSAAGVYSADYFWLTIHDGTVVRLEAQDLP